MGMKFTQGAEGKYDDLATMVREKAEARAVVLVVVGGNKGMGFTVQEATIPGVPRLLGARLAELLHGVADCIAQGAPPTGETTEIKSE